LIHRSSFILNYSNINKEKIQLLFKINFQKPVDFWKKFTIIRMYGKDLSINKNYVKHFRRVI